MLSALNHKDPLDAGGGVEGAEVLFNTVSFKSRPHVIPTVLRLFRALMVNCFQEDRTSLTHSSLRGERVDLIQYWVTGGTWYPIEWNNLTGWLLFLIPGGGGDGVISMGLI